MPNAFRMSIKAGRFDTNVKRLVDQHCDGDIDAAAVAAMNAGKDVTNAFKRTGRLTGSWRKGHAKWQGNKRTIPLWPDAPYAPIVNKLSKKNHNYIDKARRAARNPAMSRLRRIRQSIAPHLWVKAK